MTIRHRLTRITSLGIAAGLGALAGARLMLELLARTRGVRPIDLLTETRYTLELSARDRQVSRPSPSPSRFRSRSPTPDAAPPSEMGPAHEAVSSLPEFLDAVGRDIDTEFEHVLTNLQDSLEEFDFADNGSTNGVDIEITTENDSDETDADDAADNDTH
jgi:hypothetical protein